MIVPITNRTQFQLRYCPALSKKPIAVNQDNNDTKPEQKKKFDPFENPPADLLITQLPQENPTHILVLNKFPVIPCHFILATKAYKQQTHELEEEDLGITYSCLKAWEDGSAEGEGNDQGERRLFAFFNSGPASGASQPHRHIQFLPIEKMHQNEPETQNWQLLLDILSSNPSTKSTLPFTVLTSPLPKNPSPSHLHATYKTLYTQALSMVENHTPPNPSNPDPDPKTLPISYNLALTTTSMALCPRLRDGKTVYRDDGSEIGVVALNGTVLGGTLMVKGEEEWDVLRGGPEVLDAVLGEIGIPTGEKGEDVVRGAL